MSIKIDNCTQTEIEEKETPVAKLASKGIKTLIKTTPKNFQEAQKISLKLI